MKLQRLVSRTLFYSEKFLLNLLSYFSHRKYMPLYVRLLKKNGMKFTGTPRYIAKTVQFDDFDKITLGDRVVISGNVRFLTHDYSYTTALISQGKTPFSDVAMTRPITIGNNVFIGANSFLLPGTAIGDNCIIGAGCVVRGRVKPRSVCIGNPAQMICTIDELSKKWENISLEDLRED